MATTHFTSFAVAGPGDSSEHLISSLLGYRKSYNSNITLRILTRSTSKPKPQQESWEQQGATFHPVLDLSHDEIRKALEGVHVLYSNIGISSPFDQQPLANAARDARVNIFFPFEFGADAEGYDVTASTVYKPKVEFRRWLDESGWKGKWIGYHTGWYTEPVIGAFVGFDVLEPNHPPRVKIWGDGTAVFSTTSRQSLGEFLAHVLTHQSRERLLGLAAQSPAKTNRLRLESARISFNDLLKLVQSRCKDEIEVDRSVSTEQLIRMAQERPEDFTLDMLATYALGAGVVGKEVGGNWKEWIGHWDWKPRSLEEMIDEKLAAAGRLKA